MNKGFATIQLLIITFIFTAFVVSADKPKEMINTSIIANTSAQQNKLESTDTTLAHSSPTRSESVASTKTQTLQNRSALTPSAKSLKSARTQGYRSTEGLPTFWNQYADSIDAQLLSTENSKSNSAKQLNSRGVNNYPLSTNNPITQPVDVAAGGSGGTGITDGGTGGTGNAIDSHGGSGGTGHSGGAGGTGKAEGSIKGFGSVYVNGVKFDTRTAIIMVNGIETTEESLRAGMLVTVEGEVDESGLTGTATQVNFTYTLMGMIEDIDTQAQRIVVDGQTIIADDLTVFDRVKIEDLSIGDSIGISGLTDAKGNIVARYILRLAEAESSNSEGPRKVTLTGFVSGLDDINGVFYIGPQKVMYLDSQLEGFTDTVLNNGLPVYIEGTVDNTEADTVFAIYIENKRPATTIYLGEVLTISGIVTKQLDPYTFVVSDRTVLISSSTAYTRGTIDDIQLNTKLRVEGYLNENEELLVQRVVFPVVNNIYVDSYVSLDNFTIDWDKWVSFFEIGRKEVSLQNSKLPAIINNDTLMLDSSINNIRSFSLNDIEYGDLVTVHGRYENDKFIATRFERIDDKGQKKISVQGRVEQIWPSQIHVLGMLIYIYSDELTFLDGNNNPVSRDDFYLLAKPDTIVRAEGEVINGILKAERLTIIE